MILNGTCCCFQLRTNGCPARSPLINERKCVFMDENNQILDVTYGNFSCRLEGFEDSVETMKLVVSYFHELAGHDRFMDTDPLAPDLATLARLTEDQTGQPVDVEDTDNKISLRARSETADDTATAQAEVVETEAPENQAGAEEDIADKISDAQKADDLSSVAAKLQRMRAAAERKPASASDDFSEDLSEPVVPAAANPLSQRLSELVRRSTQAEQQVVQEPDTTEDMRDDDHDLQTSDMAPVAVNENLDSHDALEADDINVFSDLEPDTGTPAEPTFENDGVPSVDVTAEEEKIIIVSGTADTENTWDITEDEVKASEADGHMADDESSEDDFADDAELEAFMAEEDQRTETFTDDHEVAAEQEADEQTALSDADAPEQIAGSDHPPLVLTSDDKAEDEYDDYNDDDEFDLEKEVAKVEAEIAARKGNEFARRGLPRHVEDAMSRIMSQTDRHLNQPENRRHRDAFAQLKAAVAATEAARQLGDKGAGKRDPDEAYKDDLGAHDAQDDAKSPPPPLKLVKSQEVKRPEATLQPPATGDQPVDATSERLRKIASMKEADTSDTTGGFAEFAAAHGAADLADQLEAAGAYICFVEGEDDFSRPQVMKVVQSATNSEISREDGLRSFGRLLRQARLVKLANGRFHVADNTQFRPDGNKAARG